MPSPSTINSHPSTQSPWPCLETLPGLIALPRVWHARLGDMFERVKALILQDHPNPAQLLPCPRGCGLAHEIVCRPDGSLVATCCGDPDRPHEIPLTLADIMPLEVSWSRLGRTLCQPLGLDSRFRMLQPPNTIQFGAWSADAVPAVLTIQAYPCAFRRVVSELVAQLGRPFMLFAPTNNHLDVPSLGYLTGARAAFFPLNSTVLLDGHGRLCSVKTPGELFAQFTPQPKDTDEEVARRAFALVRTLDSERPMKPPTLLTVFRLYCMGEMSAAEIGRRFGCSKATVISRLNLIRQRTGADPENLRRLCVWLDKVTEDASDPRASRIRRRRLISDDQDQPEG
jgi:hypothetical protein